jgi:hypothetical protein
MSPFPRTIMGGTDDVGRSGREWGYRISHLFLFGTAYLRGLYYTGTRTDGTLPYNTIQYIGSGVVPYTAHVCWLQPPANHFTKEQQSGRPMRSSVYD